MTNSLLLLAEAIFYFAVMATLFRLRTRIGIGVFLCALGVMHFLETYLASVFYVTLPFGIVSPGSAIMFSGKLMMILLLYIKEDAATVRQPIYGLFIGNALIVGLVLMLRLHDLAPLADGRRPDIGFIDQMGWLMVWGTALLFVDALLIILMYEKLGRYLRTSLFLRIATCAIAVLTFDQVGFFSALHVLTGAPLEVFFGGWYAKMLAAVGFSALLAGYLRWVEPRAVSEPRGIADVFEMLTYRERYEALVEHSGRDALTGLLHRGRFEQVGEELVAAALSEARPLSLLIIDVDHFKSINDRFGHAQGDDVLKSLASLLLKQTSDRDHVFRIGGEEFAILCHYPHAMGRLLGEQLRHAVNEFTTSPAGPMSVSIGVSTLKLDGRTLGQLFAAADERLYSAKIAGRNRVIGAHAAAEFLEPALPAARHS